MNRPTAVIIGAGPAGLTAAYELLRHTPVRPLVLEASDHVGGISATLAYRGNRIDIGGHRFFSTSQRVLDWWGQFLPVDDGADADRPVDGRDPGAPGERRMLLRERRSHILHGGQLFPYPLSVDRATLRKLGWRRTLSFGAGYAHALLFPRRPVRTLEDFFVNRFGHALYRTFFSSYTEKVWGRRPDRLSAAWGAERVGRLSAGTVLRQALRGRGTPAAAFAAGNVRSLTHHFLYPKYGPGQLWEAVAEAVERLGGEIRLGRQVERLVADGGRIGTVVARSGEAVETHRADYVISTMPMKALVHALSPAPPEPITAIADRLRYRSSIIVGLLATRLGLGPLDDQWLYVQEPGVRLGRVQLFNNWSRALVADPDRCWIGMEYFCDEGDALWNLPDAETVALAVEEGERIGLLPAGAVHDGTVVRQAKSYPVYADGYYELDAVRQWLERHRNLFLVGRNGMHRYLNQDGAMLSAMAAVEEIRSGRLAKGPVWASAGSGEG